MVTRDAPEARTAVVVLCCVEVDHMEGLPVSYHISTTVRTSFEEALANVTAALKQQGFGVLTEIDVQKALKEKIGAEFRPYRILGACNPNYAHKALQAEEKIGIMLPCNVVVQEREDGTVEVSAVDPIAAMQAVENPDLAPLAQEVLAAMEAVINSL